VGSSLTYGLREGDAWCVIENHDVVTPDVVPPSASPALLRARYGFDGSRQTRRQIGNRMGLSAERVRQIEERALGKLRDSVAA
jgi:hypothetical protein